MADTLLAEVRHGLLVDVAAGRVTDVAGLPTLVCDDGVIAPVGASIRALADDGVVQRVPGGRTWQLTAAGRAELGSGSNPTSGVDQ